MEARAYLRNERISPRKVQIVLDLIRNKPVDVALATLEYTPKAASPIVSKLLKSAVANAVNNEGCDEDSLYVSECFVNAGPTLKRMRARAKGSGARILKRTSHITIAVSEKAEEKKESAESEE